MNKGIVSTSMLITILTLMSFVLTTPLLTDIQKNDINSRLSKIVSGEVEVMPAPSPIVVYQTQPVEPQNAPQEAMGTPEVVIEPQANPEPESTQIVIQEPERIPSPQFTNLPERKSQVPACGIANGKTFTKEEFLATTLEERCLTGNIFTLRSSGGTNSWHNNWACQGMGEVRCWVNIIK